MTMSTFQKINRKILTKSSSGFSLMELILIMVILGIFVTMALTRTNAGLSTIKEGIAVDQLTSDIDLVRSMAFGKHDTITIVFSSIEESYTIFAGPDGDREVMNNFPNSDDGVIFLKSPTMSSIDIQETDFSGSSELQFLPFGKPKAGGYVMLNSKKISIEPFTGKWTIN